MMKLMIVDDEAIIRKGIHYYIDWKAHDIEVVAEAANGQEGLKLALQQQPDILVTDIKMPVMDGIEMAQRIREVAPDMRIIILTGYNENEYLHSAIKFGVTDFILKTANPADIVNGVLSCKQRILEERAKKSRASHEIPENNYHIFRRGLMQDILAGQKSDEDIRLDAARLDVELAGPLYFPFLLNLSDTAAVDAATITLLLQLETYRPFITQDDGAAIAGVLNLPDENAPPQALLETVIKKLQDEKVPHAKLLTGQPVKSFTEVSRQFWQLHAMLPALCWSKDYSVTPAFSLESKDMLPLDIILILENEILQSFTMRNAPDFQEKVGQYYQVAQNNRVPINELKESVKRMVTSMYNIMNAYQSSYESLRMIADAKTVEEVFVPLRDIIQSYAVFTSQSPIVRMAINYIEKNYSQIVSLQDVSNACYVTPSYLSKVFKAEMNMGLLKYIHHYRIQKAKVLLLSTNCRVSEIAAQVGYTDYKHFSAYFLKFVEMSPREYRYQNRSGQQ